MKAIPGRRYAQLVNGTCRWRFDAATLPEWADGGFDVVDITDLPQEPDEGDLYDGSTFTKPPGPTPEQIAEAARRAALRSDALAVELLAQLRAATPAQISNYVDAQVTDLASARTMFKRIMLILAN